MGTSTKVYTIVEHEGFTRDVACAGYQSLPKDTFDALESFVLANREEGKTEAVELLALSVRRGVGKIISARNYVGLITMKDGTVIEILPKIHHESIGIADTKRLFLSMLKAQKEIAFKDFEISSLRTDRLSLLEIFIAMFLREVAALTKQGLKSSYSAMESNEQFFKGKLLIGQDIKKNLAARQRIFIQYDEFTANRPENRLLKTTLRYLFAHTQDAQNKHALLRLIDCFEKIDCSTNYDADFARCTSDRSMSHYAKALSWCKVFLKGNSFTAFAGSAVAVALLFPMETVFENYIAAKVRLQIPEDVSIRVQDGRYCLFDRPSPTFALRPDIVLHTRTKTIVMDTKWKKLSSNIRGLGIDQSDMYQMYAYAKKYHADTVVLVYPLVEEMPSQTAEYQADDGVQVEVFMIDLLHCDQSISQLLHCLQGQQ